MISDNLNVARIQFYIPVLNEVDLIDDTIKSIWNQDYDKELIYITVMDFGSTDGTFEKLLSYPSYHFGVYQNKTTKNRRQMIARMVETTKKIYPGGHYCFTTVLYPGDILYPEFARVCVDAMITNQANNLKFIICEADVMDDFGNVVKQEPLFDKDCIINGYTQMTEYVKRGYRHQIHCMKSKYSGGLYREIGESNENRWWNKCARRALEELVLYIKTPLICERRISYEDELEEILLRWESLIIQMRTYKDKFGKIFDDDFVTLGSKNVAEYAIWRSFLIHNIDIKAAEDCFLISGAIYPEIKRTELYNKMDKVIYASDSLAERYLADYFVAHGMN